MIQAFQAFLQTNMGTYGVGTESWQRNTTTNNNTNADVFWAGTKRNKVEELFVNNHYNDVPLFGIYMNIEAVVF